MAKQSLSPSVKYKVMSELVGPCDRVLQEYWKGKSIETSSGVIHSWERQQSQPSQTVKTLAPASHTVSPPWRLIRSPPVDSVPAMSPGSLAASDAVQSSGYSLDQADCV